MSQISDPESVLLCFEANAFLSQIIKFVWMFRTQSLVEIAQKADIVPSWAAGQCYVRVERREWFAYVDHAIFNRLCLEAVVGERVMASCCLQIDIRFPFVVVTTNNVVSGATGRAPGSAWFQSR